MMLSFGNQAEHLHYLLRKSRGNWWYYVLKSIFNIFIIISLLQFGAQEGGVGWPVAICQQAPSAQAGWQARVNARQVSPQDKNRDCASKTLIR